ncbi:MAG: MFS transporter, partial [Verrucomicrobiae bacterium]|nr:MFS transporter [Verrucomicrobiae bacterium]
DWFVSLAGILFAFPFILFTMTGGYCATRYSKRDMAVKIKFAEIVIMSLGAVGLFLGNIYFLLGVITLMSTQSAFFGPVKYGLLPELLEEKQLSWGNGYIGLGTFVAIILGTIAGGYFFDWFDQQVITGCILATLATAGFFASRTIRPLEPSDPEKKYRINFLGEFWEQFQYTRKDRVLFLSVMGSTYFWFVGALVQQAVMIYGRNELHLSFRHTSVLYATMALGIGAGSFAAGYISSRKIEYGLIPLGAVGISAFSFCLGQSGLSTVYFSVFLGLLGFFGGFYIVPINALIQYRPEDKRRGSIIAMQGLLSWVGIVFASLIYYFLKRIGLSTGEVFIFIGVVTLIGTIYVVWLLPDALLRLLLVFATHTLYRIKVIDRENLPTKGGLLLVSNHMSYVDALLLFASVDRPIRFIMAKDIYDIWYFKPGAKALKVIPIPTTVRPKETVLALHKARECILDGEVVCIFAEGRISRTGELLEFRKGFERIMKGLNEPIVPVNLQGVWGSIFSFKEGRVLTKWPEKLPYPVKVSF